MGDDIYEAVAGARVDGPGWTRIVRAGERINIRDGRDSWLPVAQPANWRRQGARNGWLRCVKPFSIRSTPPLYCRVGDLLHEGDIRVQRARDRFEEIPPEAWPAD